MFKQGFSYTSGAHGRGMDGTRFGLKLPWRRGTVLWGWGSPAPSQKRAGRGRGLLGGCLSRASCAKALKPLCPVGHRGFNTQKIAIRRHSSTDRLPAVSLSLAVQLSSKPILPCIALAKQYFGFSPR